MGTDKDKNRHSNVKVILITGVMRMTIGSGAKSGPVFSNICLSVAQYISGIYIPVLGRLRGGRTCVQSEQWW